MSGSIGGGWQSRGSPSQMSEKPSGQRSVLGGHNQRRASRLPHRGRGNAPGVRPLRAPLRDCERPGSPTDRWGWRSRREVDDAPFELDDEQHVITAEQNGVDREEISGQEAFGLGAEELAPAGPNSPGRGSKAVTAEDAGDAGFRDIDAELSKFPDDAEVAPAGVLASRRISSTVSSGSEGLPTRWG